MPSELNERGGLCGLVYHWQVLCLIRLARLLPLSSRVSRSYTSCSRYYASFSILLTRAYRHTITVTTSLSKCARLLLLCLEALALACLADRPGELVRPESVSVSALGRAGDEGIDLGLEGVVVRVLVQLDCGAKEGSGFPR